MRLIVKQILAVLLTVPLYLLMWQLIIAFHVVPIIGQFITGDLAIAETIEVVVTRRGVPIYWSPIGSLMPYHYGFILILSSSMIWWRLRSHKKEKEVKKIYEILESS